MRPSHRTRQLLTAAFVATALRPPKNYWLGAPAMFTGGPTAEMAPQVLALTVGQAGYAVAKGRRDPIALAAAGASSVGLAFLIKRATEAGGIVESALVEALGGRYRDELDVPVGEPPHRPEWRRLIMPVRLSSPTVRIERDLSYGDDRRNTLDVFLPATPQARPGPILVHIHGGGWTSGDKRLEGVPLLLQMAERGWIGVNINYRFAPKQPLPAAVVDVKRAIAWIRDHAADYGADPSFLAVSGGSAGGHLAALAALTGNDARFQPGFEDADTSVQAATPHYGIYDFAAASGTPHAINRRDRFLGPIVMKRAFADAPDEFEAVSPVGRISDQAPPFFVIHGTNDTGVEIESARFFVDRLRQVSSQPVAFAELPGAQHAFDYFPSIRADHVADGVERFLRWTLARHRA